MTQKHLAISVFERPCLGTCKAQYLQWRLGLDWGELWMCHLFKDYSSVVDFKDFFTFSPTGGNDPICIIFFKWVENTN